MDARKVLPWLKQCVEARWQYGRYYRPCCGFRYASGDRPGHKATCKLATLIAEAEAAIDAEEMQSVKANKCPKCGMPLMGFFDCQVCDYIKQNEGRPSEPSISDLYRQALAQVEELQARIADIEREAGGWKRGTEPPDSSRVVLVLTEGGRFPGEVPFHIHTGVYGRDARSDKVSWYANNTRDEVKWWQDLPPLPEEDKG